jgi:ElaB/YqjD/DUF883 family membrane-anchored ribosome-binding protein
MSTAMSGNVFRIAEQVDSLAHETGESLHGAASSIRQSGQQGSKAIEDLSECTATRLDRAGSYIEEHDLKHAIGGSRQLVRRYPVESLALAASVGFLAGLAIRRLTHVCANR